MLHRTFPLYLFVVFVSILGADAQSAKPIVAVKAVTLVPNGKFMSVSDRLPSALHAVRLNIHAALETSTHM